MPTPDGHRYLPSTAVFLVELLRLAVCLTIALYEISKTIPRSMPLTALFDALGNATFSGDSWKIALPAGLYTLANSLQYVAISNLDAATFHVTYQFKIIVTAVLSVYMLRRTITARQWLSLILLMVGVAIVSLPQEERRLASSHHSRVYVPRSLNPLMEHFGLKSTEPQLQKRSATYEGITEDEDAMYAPIMDASIGLAAVFCVCMCSGLAGVYFEKVIKESHRPVSMWVRNVQLSLYSMFPAFFIGCLFLDGEMIAKHGFFAGYNSVVVISILVQTFGAVVAAFCMFYADNISKNFALSISMVISALASVVLFDFQLTTHVSRGLPVEKEHWLTRNQFVIGTAIVLGSTYLYTLQGSPARPPLIKIDSFQEKEKLMSPTEAKDASISIPKTPLSLDDTTITTSRPGSPAPHKKRKNDSGGYFPRVPAPH
ncbi:UDP-galactose transporter Gms1 [Knufia obscura]|uniref:UDP-galactose transporter Gms1 n=1 Tax=Knufia obscura TaxID=1635080 RepID=A0ABR0RVD7_9EURO|nr:UDP-galactose transporter Gms1 [Knufia obscura]